MLIFMLIFAALLVLCPLALSRRLLVRRYMLPCQKCSTPARFAVIADLHSSLYGAVSYTHLTLPTIRLV